MSLDSLKNFALIILSVLVIALSYFLFVGYFCSCSPVRCPVDNPLRSYLS